MLLIWSGSSFYIGFDRLVESYKIIRWRLSRMDLGIKLKTCPVIIKNIFECLLFVTNLDKKELNAPIPSAPKRSSIKIKIGRKSFFSVGFFTTFLKRTYFFSFAVGSTFFFVPYSFSNSIVSLSDKSFCYQSKSFWRSS